MKNLYLQLFTVFTASIGFGQSCFIPGSSACNPGGAVYCTSPAPNSVLPDAELNQQYATVVQISTDNLFQGTIPIQSFYIEYVEIPEGLFVETVLQNGTPFVFPNYSIAPGEKDCFTLMGTPTLNQNNQELKLRAVATIGGVDNEQFISYYVNVVVTGTSGIDEANASLVESISPNPATNTLTISSSMPQTVCVYSILGEKVQEITLEESATLDISTWDKGLYLFQFLNSGNMLRLVKD